MFWANGSVLVASEMSWSRGSCQLPGGVSANKRKLSGKFCGVSVTARIHIPPYAPYFLVFVPILVIDLRDRALMRYDIVEGFCSYLCSRACEVV
jgi:hypothetical protein